LNVEQIGSIYHLCPRNTTSANFSGTSPPGPRTKKVKSFMSRTIQMRADEHQRASRKSLGVGSGLPSAFISSFKRAD
jgi:hypothetical protein